MTIRFNHHVTISSDSNDLTFIVYKAVKKELTKKFGEKSIVLSGTELKPSKNDLWFANIYLDTEDMEVNDASSR